MNDKKPKSRSNLFMQGIIKSLKNMSIKTMVKKKTFCPPNMVRCDNFLPYFQHYTVWACTICKTFSLNKKSAIEHANQCKLPEDVPIQQREASRFLCRICGKAFKRSAAWLRHVTVHANRPVRGAKPKNPERRGPEKRSLIGANNRFDDNLHVDRRR